MYIEQLQRLKVNNLLYLICIVSFFSFFGLNFVLSSDTDSNQVINTLIEQMGKNFTFVMLVFPLSMMCLCLWFWYVFAHSEKLQTLTTSRTKVDWKRIFFSFGIWAFFQLIVTFGSYLIYPEDFKWNFDFQAFWPFLLFAIVLIPLQTSFEEYFFRGYFMQYLGFKLKSRGIALFVTSILFGLLHFQNPEVGHLGYGIMIFYIGTGLFLGILTLMDDGLELSLGFHAANNLITALLVTSDHSVFQTNAILKDVSTETSILSICFMVLVIYSLLLLLFAKKYKWNNWKTRLFGYLRTN